jgi:hypothetical protein
VNDYPFFVEDFMRQVLARAAGIGLAVLLLPACPAQAGPLNPSDFTSLGTLDLTSGSYSVNTDTLVLTAPGGVNFNGVLSSAATGSIAVFDFSSITLDSGASLTATGSHPLALLSQGSVTMNGTLNLNGTSGGVLYFTRPGVRHYQTPGS